MKFEKILPHLLIAIGLLLAAVFYFKPVVFDGKSLREHDNVQARGMQAELLKYKEQEKRVPLWTNQVFMGMPSYQILGSQSNNMVSYICYYGFRFGTPVNTPHVILFMMMLFTYLGLLAMGVDKWVSAFGALAFGFMTNNLILFEAGHSTKLYAMVFMAPIWAGAVMAFRGKIVLGAAILGFCVAGQVGANHLQITYYTFLVLGFLGLGFLVDSILKKALPTFAKAAVAIGITALLGITANLSLLWTTYEYSKETIRGGSELSAKAAQGDGLDKPYIFSWSYGKMETFTLLIPHFYGGSSSDFFADDASRPGLQFNNSHSANAIKKLMANVADPNQQNQVAQQLIMSTGKYWGAQPFTSGPVYLGAGLILFFFLGLLMVKGSMKWAIVGVSFFFILLSWGDNFKAFNYFMVDYFPMLNKFRAVTMALSVVQLLAVIMAAMGLAAFLKYDDSKIALRKNKGVFTDKILAAFKMTPTRVNHLYLATGITVFLCLLGLAYSFVGSLEGPSDAKMLAQAPQFKTLVDAIQKDRAALIQSDTLRSLIFVVLCAAPLWALASKKLHNGLIALGIAGGIAVIDLVMVDRLYVNDDSYEPKKHIQSKPKMLDVDKKVLADKTLHFRVYDLIAGMRTSGRQGNPFANSEGAYYHKILGGYHAAKPIILQEVAETYCQDMSIFTDHLHILGMMGVKYILQSETVAVENPQYMGNCWFVSAVDFVETADAELAALPALAPRSKAVTRKTNEAYFKGWENTQAVGDYIQLTSYHPERLTYQSKTTNDRLAVFSEIYYPPKKGWNVYIDGKKIDGGFIKVNYLLRALHIPAGEHTIEMKFEPRSFYIGETVSLFSSLLILGVLGLGIYLVVVNRNKKETLESDYLDELPIVAEEISEEKEAEEKTKASKKKKK